MIGVGGYMIDMDRRREVEHVSERHGWEGEGPGMERDRREGRGHGRARS